MLIDIDVRSDMGPLAGDPVRLLERLASAAVLRAAESYTLAIHDWVEQGRAFETHTGGLEGGTNWRPVGPMEALVYSQAEYAPFVEHGTGKYAGHSAWVIEPKGDRKTLKIPVSGGGYIFRRSVTHPGSKPYPFFFADREARLAAVREAALDAMQEALSRG